MKKVFLMALAAVAMTANAQTEVSATLDLGDFENSTEQLEGSVSEQAPFNLAYVYSGAQVIYQPEEIAPLFEHPSKIKSITFRFADNNFMCYNEFTASVGCYLQFIDDDYLFENAPASEPDRWYAPVGKSADAIGSLSYSYDLQMGFDVTLTFSTPFEVTSENQGKSLLLTSWCSSPDMQDEDSNVKAMVYGNSSRQKRFASYASDTVNNFLTQVENGGEITTADHGWVWTSEIPVARIAYTYAEGGQVGVDEITAGEASREVYDLQGRRVSTLDGAAAGIYVVRQGDKTSKVVVR